MSRTSVMTIGILLILLGIKLNLIESYQLSQGATKFWMERIEDPAVAYQSAVSGYQGSYQGSYQGNQTFGPFQSASYAAPYANPNGGANFTWPQKVITPPNWLCWPVFFLGAVLLLHGISLRQS